MGTIFHVLFYQPTFNLLIIFYRLFGDNLGIAIIMLAILSRLITYPMTKAQLKAAEKNKVFQKQYNAIKKKFAKNKQKLNEELARLQSKFLPGQIAGCFPLILLIIFLIQVRNVIRALVVDGALAFNAVAYPFISKFAEGTVINFKFLGMDLSKVATNFSWSDKAIIPYVILAVLVGLSQYVSTLILTGITRKPKEKKQKDNKKGKKKEEEPDMSQMMGMMNKQMMFLFPILTVVTSLGYWGGDKYFPSGISIFWTIQSLFVIIQQLVTNRKKVALWINLKLLKKGTPGEKPSKDNERHRSN